MSHETTTAPPVTLDKEALVELFKTAERQQQIMLAIYHMIFGKELFDRVEKFTGYCYANASTNDWLMRQFITFDRKHHPNVISGGLWLNSGFSTATDEQLADFQVIPASYLLRSE